MKTAILTLIFFGNMLFSQIDGDAQMQSYPRESEQLAFASELLGNSDFQSAASTFEDFIRQFPHSPLLPNAYVGAGDSHFFLKETGKAMEYYQLYKNQYPHGKDTWLVELRLAQCLYVDGKKDAAIAKLNGINPSSIQQSYKQTYYFYLGNALMDKGDLREAAQNFEKVVEIKSNGEYATAAYLHLSAILARLGRNKDALDIYNNALQSDDSLEMQAKIKLMQGIALLQAQKYDIAASTFENIVDTYPNLAAAKEASTDWFMALLKNNRSDRVIDEYDQRFKDNFDDPATGPIHLLAVNALLVQKRDADALNILNALIASSSMGGQVKSKAVGQKARILADKGQLKEALVLLDSQIPQDDKTKSSYETLKGRIFLGLGNDKKAEASFLAAARIEPDNPAVICGRAHVLHAQGHDARSASLFMECFRKSSDDAYGQEALFSAFLMYQKNNALDEAVKTAKLYQARFPQGAHIYEVLFNLAQLFSRNKQYDQAISLLKAVSASSSYQYQREALFQVAYNLQLAGKTQEALKLYGVIVDQNTDHELSYMSLKNSMMIYAQNNDLEKAASLMDAIVMNYPSNDLSADDYTWLADHWKNKNDSQRARKVLAAYHLKSQEGHQAHG